MEHLLQTPYGEFRLQRYPRRNDEPLQAWNNADQLLLELAAQTGIPADKILVVNDEHGAISIPLGPCTVWTDSALTEQAIVENAVENKLAALPRVIMLNDSLEDSFELVLLRMPKHLSLLRWQLAELRRSLAPGTRLIAAGMQKHLGPGREKILEQYYGPAERHEGWRKARSFSAELDPSIEEEFKPLSHWFSEELQFEVSTWPGVFSHDKLDLGTRFMLENLPRELGPARFAVDLACGSGILGLYLAHYVQCRSIGFVDESALAVASARYNYHKIPAEKRVRSHFIQADGFSDWQEDEPDLVLCNPPFHMEHTVDDYAGRRLIEQTARILDIDGELWLVANRHLMYGRTLRRHFHEVEQHAQDARFTLWVARK